MKKLASWLTFISLFVFAIAWGIGGIMILNHDYERNAWVYVVAVSLIILLWCLLYLKTSCRCPHCGKMRQSFGKYCPYCGKEIN